MKYLLVSLSILFLSHRIFAGNVEFFPCELGEGEAKTIETMNCNVSNVQINPCTETDKCVIKRGKSVNVEFDFVSSVDVDTVENDVYWAGPEGDMEWQGLFKDACQNVNCPVKKGEAQKYSYPVTIDKKVPPRDYDVKWKMVSGTDLKCCFIVTIKIKK